MELPAKEVMILVRTPAHAMDNTGIWSTSPPRVLQGAWHTCRVDHIGEEDGEERYHLKSFAPDALIIALCRCVHLPRDQ